MEKHNEEIEIDVIRLLKAIWQKIWLVILLAVVGAGIAFCYASFLITPTYQSSTLVYVNSNTLNVGEVKMTVSDLSASSNLVDYYIIILKSRSTLNNVIEEAELDCSYETLRGMISAESVDSTGIFRITVTSTDPYEAEKIANTITYVLPERIEEIMVGTRARIVDYAVVPTNKSAPNITRYTAIGLLLGFVLACGIIVIAELLDDLIHGGDYLSETYTIPVLAEIPELLGEKGGGRYGKYSRYSKYSKYDKYSKYAKYSSYDTSKAKEGQE